MKTNIIKIVLFLFGFLFCIQTFSQQPDPYQKGVESSVHIWITESSAVDWFGIAFQAYDFDKMQTRKENDGFQGTYKTIGIGEYDYTSQNLKALYRQRMNLSYTWLNWTDSSIASMTNSFGVSEPYLSVNDFRNTYGSWFTLLPNVASYVLENMYEFRDKEGGTLQTGWALPMLEDIMQMIGQAPSTGNVNFDLLNFVGASAADVPANHNAHWYSEHSNISGLGLTPLGSREPIEGDLTQHYYAFKTLSKLRLRTQSNTFEGTFSFYRNTSSYSPYDYHYHQVRYCRPKTDQELGYKLYINNCKDEVVMLPYGTQSDFVELPKGLERGVALRYANRKSMKILRKWSEICEEADQIRQSIPTLPARQTFEYPPCIEEPEIPDNPDAPDPYERGPEGAMSLFVSSAAPYYGIYAYDYDNNVARGEYSGSWKTYPTIGIGEYEVTAKNLLMHYRNKWSIQLGWATLSQSVIDQMNQEYNGQNNVDLSTFNDINGSYVSSWEEAKSYRESFRVTEPDDREKDIPGWNLIGSTELFQFFGQAPKISDNPLTNIMHFLAASKEDVPAGYTADWFNNSNISGFTMTPLGRRHSGEGGENGQKWFGYKVESSLRLKDYPEGLMIFNISQGITLAPKLYHLSQARYSRAKTDEELGYKLYINNCKDEVVMLPYATQSDLVELPKGLERGVALRYANRKYMKILRKWSEICEEADRIRGAIPTIPARQTFEYPPCKEEPEVPEKPNPEIPEIPDPELPEANISLDQNYIHTTTYLNEEGTKFLDNIQYFDGLGRPMQQVQRGISNDRKDLVVHQEYDEFGRESKVWLPIVSDKAGAYVPFAEIESKALSTYRDNNAYSEPVYEASPLNRILQQYGPGEKWRIATESDSNKGSIQTAFLTNDNTSELSCILYQVGGSRENPTLIKKGNYDPQELYVTRITDEEGNTAYEFKDKLGQVVLARQNDGTQNLDTYYVFDDFGNQCFVLPPHAAGVESLNDERINQYAYLYKFDDFNHCISKKLPGCDWVFYVYDKSDRIILSQDGEQKKNNQWMFNTYDSFGRLVLSGEYAINESHEKLRADYKDIVIKQERQSGSPYGYNWSQSGFPESYSAGVNTAYYYDDYNHFLDQLDSKTKALLSYQSKEGYNTRYEDPLLKGRVQGQLVGTLMKLLGSEESEEKVYSIPYYDYRGRIIQTRSINHMGGSDNEYVAYDFTGQPLQKLHEHIQDGKTTSELYTYKYDHANRLLQTIHQLNDGNKVLLTHNEYDELGRLKSTKVGNQEKLKSSYAYNIRSWTDSINSSLYSQQMDYTLNGNVDWMEWMQQKQGNKTVNRKYEFEYDKLSRLLGATSTQGEDFSTSYSYDMQGNMKTLTRNGILSDGSFGQIDNLNIYHTGNQIKRVEDQASAVLLNQSMNFLSDAPEHDVQYLFNANGAMKQDLNKGITHISYNALNLPQRMDINSSAAEAITRYSYTPSGQKLRVHYKWNSTRQMVPVTGSDLGAIIGTDPNEGNMDQEMTMDYVGNFIYEDNRLKTILLGNGYYDNLENKYYFYLTDHLGNNRIVADASGAVEQSNQYYPFGMLFAESTNPQLQDYKYNGKEIDRMHGLDMYDYSARYYNGTVPMFTTRDPHAEKYCSWSPYVYVMNNPMRWIDIDGRDPGDPFKTKIEAANDFALYYNGTSIEMNQEFGSTIYRNSNGTFSYNVARIGEDGFTLMNADIPENTERVGAIHTHGGDDPMYNSYELSEEDKEGALKFKQNEFVVTPAGQLLEFDVETNEVKSAVGASNSIPSDPKSGEKRVNEVDAKDTKPHYINVELLETRPFRKIIDHNKPDKK